MPCNGRSWYILWTFGLCILRPFDIFYGRLAYFVAIWYIFNHFGILYQEKSGNPVKKSEWNWPNNYQIYKEDIQKHA
jgi:hypothetical protein